MAEQGAFSDLDFLPTSASLKLPQDAELLFPGSICPSVYSVDNGSRILKVGAHVKMAEAEAMRFVARETNIPVPEVVDSYTEDGVCYILMSKLPGEPLGRVWKGMSSELKLEVVLQVTDYIHQLGSLRGDFYGALWQQPSEDIFFSHFPFKNETIKYGPYCTRDEYNKGLIKALQNSAPTAELGLDDSVQGLANELLDMNEDAKIFSHGDLHLLNILVDVPSGRVTGIVDWEAAGFSVRGRDYFEAKSRARDDAWARALDSIFPKEDRNFFTAFQQLDQALKRYTFI